MALKVFVTSDLENDLGQPICAVVVAENEEEARFLFEKDMKNDDVSLTDQFGVAKPYAMSPLKITKRDVTILSYGVPQ